MLGLSIKELPISIPLETFTTVLQAVVKNPQERRLFETEITWPDGRSVPVEISLEHVVKDKRAEMPRLLATVRSIAALREAQTEIKRSTYYDKLTGLPNRSFVMEELPKYIEAAKAQNKQCAVIYIDIDKFKLINDMLGHEHGDMLLMEAAKRIWNSVDKQYAVARTGSNEFLMLLEQIKSVQDVERIARRIQEAFTEPFVLDSQEIYTSSSSGIGVYPTDGEDIRSLLRNANAALRWVKELGGGGFRHYYSDLASTAPETLKLENQLHKAVKKNQLAIYYEPIVNLSMGRIVGAEARLRWKHPEQGLLLPENFMHRAEGSGLIVEIGRWLVREAVKQIKDWQVRGLGTIPVLLNLSWKQFVQQDLVDGIGQILRSSDVSPQLLAMEISDSIVMKNIDLATKVFGEFRRMGMKVSIDEFGRGYTSLHHLKHLPIDTIKIDKSFISGIASNKYDEAIITAVASMAHDMNLFVAAEGIEHENQISFLNAVGCDLGQGRFWSAALTAEELSSWIKNFKHGLQPKKS